MKKALLFDLDSSLIVTKSGKTFPVDDDDWQFNQGVLEQILPYIIAGYQFHVVSNQGGIEAGFHTYASVEAKMRAIIGAMTRELPMAESCTWASYIFCPVMDPDDPARKPNPGMVYALRDKFGLDLSACLFVGDMDSDKLCAERAGVPYADINEFLTGTFKPSVL
jgi:histidinol-phosphate phosphatase family protein